jgi:hypothetical protein
MEQNDRQNPRMWAEELVQTIRNQPNIAECVTTMEHWFNAAMGAVKEAQAEAAPTLTLDNTDNDLNLTVQSVLLTYDLSDEAWREYEWYPSEGFSQRRYRILNPQKLYISSSGTTHRVSDADGIVHVVPTVGRFGCVLRWKNKSGIPECQF